MSLAGIILIAIGTLIIFRGLIAWLEYTTTTSTSFFDFRGTGWQSGVSEEGGGSEAAMMRLPSVAVVTGSTSVVVVLLAGAIMYFKPQMERTWA